MAIAVPCDVRDEDACNAAVATAVEAFGGLDAVVYAPGISSFDPLAELAALCAARGRSDTFVLVDGTEVDARGKGAR